MSISLKIQNGTEEQIVTLELKARKSLDGNIMIFDHEEMDIVLMPNKGKIVTFAKNDFSETVYSAQSRLFEFLKRKGVVEYESIRGGSVYGSLEGIIPVPLDENLNSIDYAIYGVYKFLKEERPYYDYMDQYEEMLDDYFTQPTSEDSTELGEVPQATDKGAIKSGYNYQPYWMSYMLEGQGRSTGEYLDSPVYIAAAKSGEIYAHNNALPPKNIRKHVKDHVQVKSELGHQRGLFDSELTPAEIGFKHGFDFKRRYPDRRGNWGLGLKTKR